MPPPLIAITPDLIERDGHPTIRLASAYGDAVDRAGGQPIVVPVRLESVPRIAERFDGFVFTGGDDPRTEPFGEPTHPKTTPMHPARQAFETTLLRALNERHPDKPVFGVCLGMQMMALVTGGRLDQHMPESTPTHAQHMQRDHAIMPEPDGGLSAGSVHSKHHQAVRDPGTLAVMARAHDGVIEAVGDPDRPFYLGVQWHPERTEDAGLGQGLFDRLVRACESPNRS